ncbi:hypothetical protein BKD30_09385 [Tersicoccus phoenicis]|uniref:Hemolysin n=1 Tax=Tersicoccus phoenicis TaxID=554083 RepID=A0A1R1L9F0_9MICC|nr:hemolysin family protein [Tersicoccus phoenicis]OMH24111.1 hypothetical protein BKD30_09385 [Tersicoccus phoenicis]
MSYWWGIVWLVILLISNAFFVGAEFAIMSARRSQIEPLAQTGHRRARTTLWAMENVSLMLACAQLGITVSSLLILQVAEPSIEHLIAGPLESVGLSYDVAVVIGFSAALLIVTFLHVTLGEMVPKNISVSVADRAALVLAPPLVFVGRLVKPVIEALNWTANHIVRLLRVEPKDEVTSTFTLDELSSIVEESTRTGLVDDDAGIISGALEFSDHLARDTMVPVDDLVTIGVGATPEEFERTVSRTGFSRFVFVDDTGNLTGYLHLKDVLGIDPAAHQRPIPESRVRTLVNLAPDEEVEDALALMQRTGSHLARVIDGSGRTLGVLFLEDIIEQLVGEIRDASQSQDSRRLG